VERADTSDKGYRAYNELIENVSRTPLIHNSNPYYKLFGQGIRAEWSGNYKNAEQIRAKLYQLESKAKQGE
jgi:hypothetical protein